MIEQIIKEINGGGGEREDGWPRSLIFSTLVAFPPPFFSSTKQPLLPVSIYSVVCFFSVLFKCHKTMQMVGETILFSFISMEKSVFFTNRGIEERSAIFLQNKRKNYAHTGREGCKAVLVAENQNICEGVRGTLLLAAQYFRHAHSLRQMLVSAFTPYSPSKNVWGDTSTLLFLTSYPSLFENVCAAIYNTYLHFCCS